MLSDPGRNRRIDIKPAIIADGRIDDHRRVCLPCCTETGDACGQRVNLAGTADISCHQGGEIRIEPFNAVEHIGKSHIIDTASGAKTVPRMRRQLNRIDTAEMMPGCSHDKAGHGIANGADGNG